MKTTLTVTPAYGREYQLGMESLALEHWLLSKDFKVNDRTNEFNGRYVNKEDVQKYAPHLKHIEVRRYNGTLIGYVDIAAGTMLSELPPAETKS